jgi:tetratricopeptide (TPR) repeat protein
MQIKNKAALKEAVVVKDKKLLSNDILLLIGICIITFICFIPELSNQFLFWDDNQFICNNVHIRRFTWANIKFLFSNEFGANWQPLTMLSYSLNYYFSKLTPFGYFFTNVLLHVANTGLVFGIVRNLMSLSKLTPSLQAKSSGLTPLPPSLQAERGKDFSTLLIPGMVSLWFGIHPMHVESVSWLFERKDVLYTFFYLSGLTAYLNYISKKKNYLLVACFILFAFSCMSKPMAVVFPASLLLIDYFINRKIKGGVIIEKIPFFLLSLIIGVLTLHTQKEEHAFIYSFSFIQRIMIASFSFSAYIYKLFAPFNLSAFYPYPMEPGQSFPAYFYLFPIISALIALVPAYIAYKRGSVWFKILLFGFGFYLVNIVLVLQFLSVGSAIISDRYSYISYIGLFFIIANVVNYFIQSNNPAFNNITIIITVLYTMGFGYLCYGRAQVWQNTGSILTDVIEQYPGRVPQAYKYLGIYYGENGKTQEAFNCYNVLINKMHLRDAQAYCNMGTVYMSQNKDSEAVKYLLASLQIDSNQFMSYRNLGIITANRGDYKGALAYYAKANHIYPNDEGLYFNISLVHVAMQDYDAAIQDYNVLLQLNPDNPLYYFNRGVAEYSKGSLTDATNDFEHTLSIAPTKESERFNVSASAAHNLAIIYKNNGNIEKEKYYENMEEKRKGQ